MRGEAEGVLLQEPRTVDSTALPPPPPPPVAMPDMAFVQRKRQEASAEAVWHPNAVSHGGALSQVDSVAARLAEGAAEEHRALAESQPSESDLIAQDEASDSAEPELL